MSEKKKVKSRERREVSGVRSKRNWDKRVTVVPVSIPKSLLASTSLLPLAPTIFQGMV